MNANDESFEKFGGVGGTAGAVIGAVVGAIFGFGWAGYGGAIALALVGALVGAIVGTGVAICCWGVMAILHGEWYTLKFWSAPIFWGVVIGVIVAIVMLWGVK